MSTILRTTAVACAAATLVAAVASAKPPAKSAKPTKTAADPALQSAVVQGMLLGTANSCGPEEGKPSLPVTIPKFDDEAKKWTDLSSQVGACDVSAKFLAGFVTYGLAFAKDVQPKLADGHDSIQLNIYDYIYGPAMSTAAQKVLGKPLIKNPPKELTQKEQDEGKQSVEEIPAYDSAVLQQLFSTLYFGPGETRAGVVSQKFYDVVFKASVTRVATQTAAILAKKGFLAAQAKEYVAAFKESQKPVKQGESPANFYGPNWLDGAAQKLDPKAESTVSSALLGTLIRRHLDGSLPALLTMFKQLLKDYDPATFKQVEGALKI